METVAWDQPGSATPMLATMTPQEAINQGMPQPADCDVVVVIFWTRMGTPLPPEYLKPNGDRFQSGTEWEYLNAVDAARDSAWRGEHPAIPQVIIYRRTAAPQVTFDDPEFNEKKQQWERVKTFFGSFTNPDGSIRQGYNPYTTPDEFRAVFEAHMKKLIGQLLETTRAVNPPVAAPLSPIWEKSPFPGLRAFTPDDEPIFYGRGAETDALISKVRDSRFVAVVGASGSGKSSLVGAGLLPRLAANSIEGSKDWLLPSRAGDTDNRVWVGLRFTPGEYGNNPFLALANKIAERLNRTARDLADELAAHPEAFPTLLNPLLENKPAWSETLLFIDQFEELFTQVDTAKIAPFVALLKAIADSDRVRVVVTLRADFYARCVENPTLAALLQTGTYPLSAPSPVALGEMIAKPAERANLTFQEGLIQRILEDTGSDPGALALMAYLLDELYKTGRADGRLTFAEYDALGGVRGAIGKRAEEVVQRLTESQQKTLPRLFNEIVDVDGRGRATRRRADLSRFTGDADISAVIDKLTNERLLVQSGSPDQAATLEVAHEALLREWDRLATWITGAQADLLLRRQLEQSALDYASAKDADKADYLLAGGRLVEAQKWQMRYPDEKAETLAFIAASETAEAARIAAEERRKRELAEAQSAADAAAVRARNRTRIAGIIFSVSSVVIVIAVIAAIIGYQSTQTATGVLTRVAQQVADGETRLREVDRNGWQPWGKPCSPPTTTRNPLHCSVSAR